MNAAAQLHKAITRENSGDLAGAMAEYQKIVRREPSNIDALFLLGRAYCRQGQFEAGAQCFRKIIKLSSPHAPAHTLLGMALFRLGKPEEALFYLERALAADPRFELALVNKADVLAAIGRHAEAITEYDRALAINATGNAGTWCNRGSSLQTLGQEAEAIESFHRALALNPGLAEAHFNLANAFHKLKRSGEAIPHYRRAIALRPSLPDLYINLASALLALERWQEALQICEQAVSLQPGSAVAHCHLGTVLLKLGNYEKSLAHVEKALELDPNYCRALREKGRLLFYVYGRTEEALVLLERTLELESQSVSTYSLLSEMRCFAPDDPMFRAMEGLLEDSSPLDGQDRSNLHFTLAKAYRDIERHEKSFQHLIKANALARQQVHYDEKLAIGLVDRIRKVFTRELLRSKFGNGDLSDRPIFIVGMPRSGSTLIEQILASHPQVFGAGERLEFRNAVHSLNIEGAAGYPELVEAMSPAHFDKLGSEYLARIAESTPLASEARFTDKLPANRELVGLIRLALPNARIIHARRNAIDTCLSCFSISFDRHQPFTYDLGELGRYYRAYERLMEHWRQVLPEGAVLEVQYEDLVADIETQARRLIAYCGLDWDDACLAFHKTSRPVLTASVAQVRQPVYKSSVGGWQPYERHLRPLIEALGRPV